MLRMILAALALLLPLAVMAQPATQLPTVGIAEIEGELNAGKAGDLATMIETAIARSGRFRVIERSQLKTLLAEQTRCASGGPLASDPGCRVGTISPVQYVIYGKVSLQSKSSGEGILPGLTVCLLFQCKSRDTISVDLKITELPSGLLRRAVTVNYSERSATTYFQDSLFRGAAELITASLIREIFPVAIVLVRPDGSLLLNYGRDALAEGQYLMSYQLGDRIPDPSGGRIIVDKQEVGLVRVTSVMADTANASFAGGGPGPPKAGQILEPMAAPDAQAKLRAYRGPKWRPG